MQLYTCILHFIVEIVFEEFAAIGSLVDIEVQESPNLNIRTQSISGMRSIVLVYLPSSSGLS
jgi:hypothetical protein